RASMTARSLRCSVVADHGASGDCPRYSTRSLPGYAFIPGTNPHPRRDPHGHSYGVPDPKPAPFEPDQWRGSDEYRFAVDLFNFGYWWECHEVLEGFWRAVGPKTEQGSAFQ